MAAEEAVAADAGQIPPSPFGTANDILWVREPFALVDHDVVYMSNCVPDAYQGIAERPSISLNWCPARSMKREQSDLWVTVVDVSPVKLATLTESEAQAGGMLPADGRSYVEEARKQWTDAYVKVGQRWDDNPWCWRVSFRNRLRNGFVLKEA